MEDSEESNSSSCNTNIDSSNTLTDNTINHGLIIDIASCESIESIESINSNDQCRITVESNSNNQNNDLQNSQWTRKEWNKWNGRRLNKLKKKCNEWNCLNFESYHDEKMTNILPIKWNKEKTLKNIKESCIKITFLLKPRNILPNAYNSKHWPIALGSLDELVRFVPFVQSYENIKLRIIEQKIAKLLFDDLKNFIKIKLEIFLSKYKFSIISRFGDSMKTCINIFEKTIEIILQFIISTGFWAPKADNSEFDVKSYDLFRIVRTIFFGPIVCLIEKKEYNKVFENLTEKIIQEQIKKIYWHYIGRQLLYHTIFYRLIYLHMTKVKCFFIL
jgi:hypothetical protein